MRFVCEEYTHPGGRENNQDYVAHRTASEWGCFVVADGLGGHPKGEVASRLIVQSLVDQAPRFAEAIHHNPEQGISALIQSAHQKMCAALKAECGLVDAHTTFVMAWITPEFVITAHVGDSRLYRVTPKGILWRTSDHTEVQALFDAGEISEKDMLTHPWQNQLLKTVHTFDVPDPDIYIHPPLAQEERLVLCSDGFWTKMPPEDWVAFILAEDLPHRMTQWIARTIADDPGADNITLQVVQVAYR